MRSAFAIALIATLLFSGGYLYYTALAICPVPVEYRIGQFDDQFDLSREEARVVLSEAEAVWEDSTGRNLFSYNESADFTVNFIFDERQAYADAERDFRDRLDQSAGLNDEIRQRYERLITEFEAMDDRYEAARAEYEAARDAYNKRVADIQAREAMTLELFDELERERLALNDQAGEVNAIAAELQELTDQINEVGALGNRLVESYNRNVSLYNDTFHGSEAFTQGDYQGDRINIYKFSDNRELRTVLAHELGHALSLGHVEGEQSIMYYLMGGQPANLTLSSYDLEEFIAVCGADDGVLAGMIRALKFYVQQLQAQVNN